jgi:hypothetical protein
MQRKDWVRLTKGQRRAIRYRLRRAGSAAERRRSQQTILLEMVEKALAKVEVPKELPK